MFSEKNENMLNVALNTPVDEREKSANLNVGFNEDGNTWELIVKYSGELGDLEEKYPGIKVEVLAANYAILIAPEQYIDNISGEANINYIEKPKNFYFQLDFALSASCITPLRRNPYNLTGKGVLIAILDSGIDIYHRDFTNEDGSTRIYELWDQTIEGNPPEGYLYGNLYSSEEINEALRQGRILGGDIVRSIDVSGHGTAVTGIAAGNGKNSQGRYTGVAPEATLLIVKLGNANNSFPRTTRIMEALDYAYKVAMRLNMPLAINLSFGNNYGAHNGNSILEEFINVISGYHKTSIAIGSGNEGNAAIHTSGVVSVGNETTVEFSIGEFESKFNLQIWKNYADVIDVYIETPGGEVFGPFRETNEVLKYNFSEDILMVYNGLPTPYNLLQELYVDIIPNNEYISSGVYKVHLVPVKISSGAFEMWLLGGNVLGEDTKFLRPVAAGTFTVPSTASKAISVGAYNAAYDTYADFSGRGFSFGAIKPDIVADGINIMTTAVGGGYSEVTGTSFATPLVTGSAALLMQWGIINGNDNYMYGEKLKATLLRGAGILPGISEYPNERVGWGSLCVADSIENSL